MIKKKATQVLILYDEDVLYLIPVLTLIFMHIITILTAIVHVPTLKIFRNKLLETLN